MKNNFHEKTLLKTVAWIIEIKKWKTDPFENIKIVVEVLGTEDEMNSNLLR